MTETQKQILSQEQAKWLSTKRKKAAKKYADITEIIELKRERYMQAELNRQAQLKRHVIELLKLDYRPSEIADRLHLTRESVIEFIGD